MLFVVIPEYPSVIKWQSIFNLIKKRVFKVYKNKFNVYKIILDEEDGLPMFKVIDFIKNENFDLKYNSIYYKREYMDSKELDGLMQYFLLELDRKNSICIIDKSLYLEACKFMEPIIHIELFKVNNDNTYFQLINTSIVPLKEFDTYKKETKSYDIHSVYRDEYN